MSDLNNRIANFYDRSSGIWLDIWGEHMHHGFYGFDGKEKKNHQQAQIDLIEEVLKWAEIEKAKSIFDAGCGVGGSSRYLSKKFGAQAYGVTLSPYQAEAAAEYNRAVGLENAVKIEARDMMSVSEGDRKFDFIWSMESAEHIKDKKALLEMFFNLLEPGGKFLMITWCCRDQPPAFSRSEKQLLENLYESYHLPPMMPMSQIAGFANEAGFLNLKTDNWSKSVEPFWKAVVSTALTPKGMMGLFRSGWGTIKGAIAMKYMIQGLRSGLVEFDLLTGQKPE